MVGSVSVLPHDSAIFTAYDTGSAAAYVEPDTVNIISGIVAVGMVHLPQYLGTEFGKGLGGYAPDLPVPVTLPIIQFGSVNRVCHFFPP